MLSLNRACAASWHCACAVMAASKTDSDRKIVAELISFCSADDFQIMAEEFCLDKCHIFTDDEEHKLEYTYLHHEFQQLFEGRIETFIRDRNIGQREFYKMLREAQQTHAEQAKFIDVFLASSEYDAFVHLMRFMRNKMEMLGDPRVVGTMPQASSGAEEMTIVEGQGQAILDSLMGKK